MLSVSLNKIFPSFLLYHVFQTFCYFNDVIVFITHTVTGTKCIQVKLDYWSLLSVLYITTLVVYHCRVYVFSLQIFTSSLSLNFYTMFQFGLAL